MHVKSFLLLLTLTVFFGCKEKYLPPPLPGTTNNLVVEGYINAGTGPTIFHLSRTVKLVDSVLLKFEQGAQVVVEGEDNSAFSLSEMSPGDYEAPQLPINPAVQYRLRINSSNGQVYLSDYTPVRITPPIDSLSWKRENGGVQFYIHTHDPSNTSRYYHWEYEETWEIHSFYVSSLTYAFDLQGSITGLAWRDSGTHSPDPKIYRCWRNENSSSIMLGSSSKLASDVIYLPFKFIPDASERISVLYSIRVKQYALTKDAYEFLQRMKRNTEDVGTVFDPQPSELNSNIHCLSNPDEKVVGYVSAGDMKEVRIFIDNRQLSNWGYHQSCNQVEVTNNIDSIMLYSDLTPTVPAQTNPFGGIITYFAATAFCVDCTLRGTNIKPSFWP